MKKLVIAEKPSVGRDIARVLGCKQQGKKYIEGNEYIVTWGLGHLVTLADPEGYDKKLKTWRMEDLPMMPERFKLVVIPQTRGQFQAVKSLIERKDVGEIIIATDAGLRSRRCSMIKILILFRILKMCKSFTNRFICHRRNP